MDFSNVVDNGLRGASEQGDFAIKLKNVNFGEKEDNNMSFNDNKNNNN